MKKTVEEANSRIETLERRNDDNESRITKLEGLVHQQQGEIRQLRRFNNDRERHSRSWNLVWRTNVAETPGEDTSAVVRGQLFAKVPAVKEQDLDIDVSHRIGPKRPDAVRPIIIRLVRKSDVWFLLSQKRSFSKAGAGLLFQDLTKEDRDTKAKYQTEINQLVEQGKKARFQNGTWIVNSKPYPG